MNEDRTLVALAFWEKTSAQEGPGKEGSSEFPASQPEEGKKDLQTDVRSLRKSRGRRKLT